MKEYVHPLPSFQQISSALDGYENAISRLLYNYDGYISKQVYVLYMMNMEMYIL